MPDLYNFPNMSEGADNLLIGLATEVPIFPIMALVFVWAVIGLGGPVLQMRRTGSADFSGWILIAFLTTNLLALIMSFTGGIIGPVVLSVSVAGTIFAGLWFFINKGGVGN